MKKNLAIHKNNLYKELISEILYKTKANEVSNNLEYNLDEQKHYIAIDANYIIDSSSDFKNIDMYIFNEKLLKDYYVDVKRILTHYHLVRNDNDEYQYIIKGSDIYNYKILDSNKLLAFQSYVASMTFKDKILYESFVRFAKDDFMKTVNASVKNRACLNNIVSIKGTILEKNALSTIISTEKALENGELECKVRTR